MYVCMYVCMYVLTYIMWADCQPARGGRGINDTTILRWRLTYGSCRRGTYIHTYMHTYIHTYMHAYINTYRHTYIRRHPFIHTRMHIIQSTFIHMMDASGAATSSCHTYHICAYIHTICHMYISCIPRTTSSWW